MAAPPSSGFDAGLPEHLAVLAEGAERAAVQNDDLVLGIVRVQLVATLRLAEGLALLVATAAETEA